MWYLYLLFLFLATSAYADDSTIPAVVVSVGHATSSPDGISQQTLVITEEQIKQSGATRVAEVLQAQDGVQVIDLTGDGSNIAISILGFGENATANSLVLLNGVPLINPDLSSPDINSIPIAVIKKIEIIPASESVLYGDQAVGGVINIITKTDIPTQANIGMILGSYNQASPSVLLADRKGPLSYFVTNQITHNDNYRDHNTNNYNQLYGQVAYQTEERQWRFEYLQHNQQLLLAGALTIAQLMQDRRQAQNHSNFTDNLNQLFHFNYQQKIWQDWQFIADIAHRNNKDNGFIFSHFTQSSTVNTLIPKIRGYLTKNILLTTGAELTSTNFNLSSIFGITQDTQQRGDIYTHILYTPFASMRIAGGFRFATLNDRLTDQGTPLQNNSQVWVPSIGIEVEPTKSWHLYLRQAGNYRFPKADENAFTPINIKGLQTQTGNSYETGAAWFYSGGSSKLSFYQLILHNEIAFDPTQTPTQPFGANRNFAKTARTGMLLSSSYQFTPKIRGAGQYQLVNARFAAGPDNGKQIPFVAPQLLRLSATYQPQQYWDFYLEGIYTASRYAVGDEANIAPKVPAYSLYNLGLAYNHRPLNISFRVNNIFNKLYNTLTSFDLTSEAEFFYPAPGRNFQVSIQYEFR